MIRTCGSPGGRPHRIAERDRPDERDRLNEVGTHSVHVAPFSRVSRFTRYGSKMLADFSSILLTRVTEQSMPATSMTRIGHILLQCPVHGD
jgi:hypothetical protein